MENNTQLLKMDNWVFRAQAPQGKGPHPVALLLHGLSGDEKVMWVFASRMPDDFLLLSLRGIHAFPGGGYSWYSHHTGRWPGLSDLSEAVEQINHFLAQVESWQPDGFAEEQQQVVEAVKNADYSQVSLVGFSQGAALSYAYALQNPQKVNRVAGLAGFMPEGVEELVQKKPLQGKKVFVSHGTKDETVPVERARHAVETLQRAGAELSYCEEAVGHKLSATCFRSLGEFFSANKTQQSSAR